MRTTRTGSSAKWILVAVLVPAICATVAGLIILWPTASPPPVPVQYRYGTSKPVFVTGTVDVIDATSCLGPGVPDTGTGSSKNRYSCLLVGVRLDGEARSAPPARVSVIPGSGNPDFHIGDRVRLAKVAVSGQAAVYYFDDFIRAPELLWLAVLFAVLVVLVARWRGLMALVGLALTYLVLSLFLLPALIRGESPVAVGLVAGSTILILVLYLAHGPSARTSTALVGTLGSLGLTGGLAAAAVASAHLTGLSSDTTATLESEAGQIYYSSLILCGIIIGAIGVLNDVTVTQASAVWELHDANPERSPIELFRSAMRIGRDHIASTVYTLVLAYAGASLPVILLLDLSGRSAYDVLTGDAVATEIISSLVGAIGLVAAVPLTTLVATLVVRAAGHSLGIGLVQTVPETAVMGQPSEQYFHREGAPAAGTGCAVRSPWRGHRHRAPREPPEDPDSPLLPGFRPGSLDM